MAPYANQIRFRSSSPTSDTATINDSNFTVSPKMLKDLLEIWSDRFFIVCGALTLCASQNELNHYQIPTLSFISEDRLPTMRVDNRLQLGPGGGGSNMTRNPHRWRWDDGAISDSVSESN